METNTNSEFNPQAIANPGTDWVTEGYRSEIQRLTRSLEQRGDEYADLLKAHLNLCEAVEDLFKRMIEDDVVTNNDHDYVEFFREWVDNGRIEIDFNTERRVRVEVNITVAYDVDVECPRDMSDSEVSRNLIYAFEAADGDGDNVDDEIGDNITISNIGVWDRDVHVDATLD